MCTYSYISKTGGFIFSKCAYAYKTYFKNIQLAIENQNLSDMDVGFLTVNYAWEHCLNKLKYIEKKYWIKHEIPVQSKPATLLGDEAFKFWYKFETQSRLCY